MVTENPPYSADALKQPKPVERPAVGGVRARLMREEETGPWVRL
jgi:hypothetical protein